MYDIAKGVAGDIDQMVADLAGKDARIALLNGTISTLDVDLAEADQEIVDLQARVDDLQGRVPPRPRLGLYPGPSAPDSETRLEAIEVKAGMAPRSIGSTWFFFSAIPNNPDAAVANNIAPLMRAGRDVIVNVSTAGQTWRSVADGLHDAPLAKLIANLNALGKFRFVFNQEPDQSGFHAPFDRGTPKDYDAALRHIRDMLPTDVPLGFALAEASRFDEWCLSPWLPSFYSVDAYTRSAGAGWTTPKQLAAANLPLLHTHGQPVIFTSGAVADPRRVAWVEETTDVGGIVEWNYWQSSQFALTDAELPALAAAGL